MSTFQLRVRLPDGRTKKCTTGTNNRERFDAMRRWVQDLKKGKERRVDVLEAIVLRDVSLAAAYDLRHDLSSVLALTGVKDLQPYVAEWHTKKAKSRKGASSADKYLRQVRKLIPEDKEYRASRFTARDLRKWLRDLDVDDPTRNRYKAALSSFADYLTDENVLERNPLNDVKGFAEGEGRELFYELGDAITVMERIDDVELRGAFALAVSAGVELQVLQRLRVRDIDLGKNQVWADGGKTRWRRRMVKMLFDKADFRFAVAQALRDKMPDALAFPTLADNRRILKAIKAAATAAKLPVLTLHDQRHTHAVNALRAGHKPTVVAHQLGHRDTSLVWKRYGRFVVEERDYVLPGAEEKSA